MRVKVRVRVMVMVRIRVRVRVMVRVRVRIRVRVRVWVRLRFRIWVRVELFLTKKILKNDKGFLFFFLKNFGDISSYLKELHLNFLDHHISSLSLI